MSVVKPESSEEVEQLPEALLDATSSLAAAASAYRQYAARHRSVGRAQPDPFHTTGTDFNSTVNGHSPGSWFCQAGLLSQIATILIE
jgi:hypothetical protein